MKAMIVRLILLIALINLSQSFFPLIGLAARAAMMAARGGALAGRLGKLGRFGNAVGKGIRFGNSANNVRDWWKNRRRGRKMH